MKTVFTTGEVAKICKVSQQTIIRCFDNGQLKGFRVPGSKFRRIPREMLYTFMKDNGMPTGALEARQQRVLLLTDDASVADAITRAFQEDGKLELKSTHCPFTAGMLIREWCPDAIILDLGLPNIDAIGICRTIRLDGNAGETVILCLGTTAEQHKVRDLATEAGVRFLGKPLDVAELVRYLRDALDVDADVPVDGAAA